mmetsp:Transcript_65798/g.189694  ORF Transcript_65798/g.189694 Transcript_65798/m.189694 type:complete len:369 (-) Transcript_65798:223-1329(-)
MSCSTSFVSEMNVLVSLTLRSAVFNSYSVFRICASQNAFLSSSTPCSFFRSATNVSTLASTCSKPFFFPRNANSKNTMRWSLRRAFFKIAPARFLTVLEESPTCKKLAALAGFARVFLNKSNASSSLSMRIVSESATFSSAIVLVNLIHSSFFWTQALLNCTRNFESSTNPCCASSSSFAKVAFWTANSPERPVFSSIARVAAEISFFFAETRLSVVAIAFCSSATMSFSCWSISSPICFKMPKISPLWGSYSELSSPPWPCVKKLVSMSRSAPFMSNESDNRFNTFAALVWRKPVLPFSTAAMACLRALMFAWRFVDSLSNASFCFVRKAKAPSRACWEFSRSFLCCPTAVTNCLCLPVAASKLDCN